MSAAGQPSHARSPESGNVVRISHVGLLLAKPGTMRLLLLLAAVVVYGALRRLYDERTAILGTVVYGVVWSVLEGSRQRRRQQQ